MKKTSEKIEHNLITRPNDVLEHAVLSAWMEASDIGLSALDNEGKVVMLNKAACDLLAVDGLSSLDASLQVLMAQITMKPGMLLLIQTPGFQGECQASRRTATGTTHLLLKFRSVRVGLGSRFKMLSVTNITAALQVQEQESMRRQWQAMNAGVVIADARSPDMPVVYVNDFFVNMTGYTSEEMVGRNCRHLQGTMQNQPEIEKIRQAIRNKTNGYAVLQNYRKDGSLFVNELFVSPIKDANGEVTHFMGIQHLRDSSFNPL